MAERRYTVVLFAALVTAVGATYGVYRVLQETREKNRIETRPVVVAAQDLAEGASIDPIALQVAQWPSATVPAGAYATLDSVVGRVARVPIFKGEPIVPGRLAPHGTGPGLEVKITPGKRAMAVRINDVAGLSGLIQPNSRVDVLVTIQDEGNSRDQVAKLFMSNMRVLSVGTQVERGPDGKPIQAATAALEVTPEEAERLAIAAREGSIQLVLRGYGEQDSVRTPGARPTDVLAQLRDAPTVRRTTTQPAPSRRPVARSTRPAAPAVTPQPVVAAPRRPDSLTVRIYRGDKVTSQKFARSDSSSASGETSP